MSVWYWLVLIAAPFIVAWARNKEADMPQCDVCSPMYFGEHHPNCPQQGAKPDANYV